MENINSFTLEKLSKVKLVVTDVDGVLTDGGLYYSSEGLVMKKFNVKDGMGTRLLKNAGILTGIITTDGDSNQLINKRAERLKLDFLYTGVWDKEIKLKEACLKYNLNLENVAFIGDDVNDLSILKEVGFSSAPSDAVTEVLDVVDLVMQKKGGEGVFRELADLILKAKM